MSRAPGGARGVAKTRAPRSWWRWVRHPLRAFSMGVAALALSWGLGTVSGPVMAVIGAVVGVLVGELMARSRLRLWDCA